MRTFWNSLPKPFFVMAPMKDVTDAAFRALVAARGKPDVFWTEFVSADGLYHTLAGKSEKSSAQAARPIQHDFSDLPARLNNNPLLRDLQFAENQRPIVAQIFSSKPEMIAYATKLVAALGFDGVDLNMGCPDRAIEKQGCGSAMIKSPEAARAVIRAAKEAAASASKDIHKSSYRTNHEFPVSVKTRVGYNKESLDEWLPVLLEEAPAAITLHLRTRKELSLAPANWELMKKAVEIRNRINPGVLLIGNGDVTSVEQGRRLVAETGADGVMIGRGMFGNPWVFADAGGHLVSTRSLDERFEALIELAHGFEAISPPKNFSILKKHIKAFVTGFAGAADLRARLMEAESAGELEKIIASVFIK